MLWAPVCSLPSFLCARSQWSLRSMVAPRFAPCWLGRMEGVADLAVLDFLVFLDFLDFLEQPEQPEQPQNPFILENSNYETPICFPSTGLGQSPHAGAARQSIIQKQRGHPAHEV